MFGQSNVGGTGVCALAVILIALTPFGSENARGDWAATFYTGRLTDGRLGETITAKFSSEDAYYVGLGVMRRIYTHRHYADLEIDYQLNKFFGDQDHLEFDLLGYMLWLAFSWDRYLDMSFAAGAGLSCAMSVPEIEFKNQGESARLSGALSFESTFTLLQIPQWHLVADFLHHHSGAGGTFGGVRSGSNKLGMGMQIPSGLVFEVSIQDFKRGCRQISSRDHQATVRVEEGGNPAWQCTDRPHPFAFVDTAEIFGFRVGRISERQECNQDFRYASRAEAAVMGKTFLGERQLCQHSRSG